MEEWKRRKGIPPETRVFALTGAFPGIRKALVARGWVENEDRTSQFWDFKYALFLRDVGEPNDLDDSQVINYFARNSEITSKAGLCNTLLNNSSMLDRVDINSFYPRCYDMNNPVQVETFVEDFKLTTAACVLRRFVDSGGRTKRGSAGDSAAGRFSSDVVETALAICRRFTRDADDALDEALGPSVSDEEWKALELVSLKNPGKRLKPWSGGKRPWNTQASRKLADPSETPEDSAAAGGKTAGEERPDAGDGGGSDGEAEDGAAAAPSDEAGDQRSDADEAFFSEAVEILAVLRGQLPQYGLDGYQNIWVMKPAGKSRGRGISLSARLENILDIGVGRGAEARWIAQKYIENPLIINNKKFDIRQWVVVTRWNPLSVWFYEDCYVRFSFADYDPTKLKNRYSHLTNNSISKHHEDFDEAADDTMWHSDDFKEHLAGMGLVRDGKPVEDPWTEIVQPAFKRIVYHSLECAQDAVLPRTSSFELFGYDFMVDEDLNAWLIEINSSPDLSYSTSTTRGLVKSMLEDMMSVVIDVEKFGERLERPRRKWNTCRMETGRYRLLEPARRRREEKFPKLKKDAAQLAVHGSGVKLRKPKRGECPQGPDAEDDPRYSAATLLAEAQRRRDEGEDGDAAKDDEDEQGEDDGDESDAGSLDGG